MMPIGFESPQDTLVGESKILALRPDGAAYLELFRAMVRETNEESATLVVPLYDEHDLVEGQYVAELHFVVRQFNPRSLT